MSLKRKAFELLGRAKETGGFGFVPKVKQASQKAYGYGRANPGKTAAIGGVAVLGGAVASSPEGTADRYKLNQYLKNDHDKWMKTEFNGEKDIMHMQDISGKLMQKFKVESSSEEEAIEKFRPAYEGFLMEASKRKGSPSAEELHNIMRSMRGKR